MYAFVKPSLVLAEPELIKFVLTKDFTSFHDRGLYCNDRIDPLSGHLFLLGGKKWRNLRVKLTPTFTSGKMKQMFGTVVDCGEKLSQFLKPKADKREVIEIKDLFARYICHGALSNQTYIIRLQMMVIASDYIFIGLLFKGSVPMLLCPWPLELLAIVLRIQTANFVVGVKRCSSQCHFGTRQQCLHRK